ncbi:MAG: glycosyl hydrolase 115 family protein [Sphingobium sp.]|nr:glycosyl hydrolase 115 family protein [Sphingobium sp.]
MTVLRRLPHLLVAALGLMLAAPLHAQGCAGAVAVCGKAVAGSFALIARGKPAAVLTDADANPAIGYAARNFADDLGRVGGKVASVLHDPAKVRGSVVVIGELGKSAILDELSKRGLIDAADIAGQWEAYRQIVVEKPWPDVPRALVIVGSDRRGAVFGAYDLSGRIGVSPWYWFADVPVARRTSVYLTPGSRRDQPGVRYRGFFINDEAPAFSTWTQKKFGGANSKAYARIFELLLRLKGNYLWPAMWAPRAFNDDDPRNMVLADAMGVVMGTSHHEPLTRAQDEWHRNTDKGVTGGKWDYTTNAENLRKFWRGGVERMMSKGDGKGYETLMTVGMRGDGDEAMSEGTAVPLLEKIVADQRKIIADVTGRPAGQQPQLWALYKEVQDYYDHGMQVPDDVTLLFADDNWGQIRRLPGVGAPPRKGGYGVYYHFDYVGAPRNYKWLDTVQIEKTWQQMDLAWQRGARTIWIVNVGDIKPEEFPLSFFMAHAWKPEKMDLAAMNRFTEDWARANFGAANAREIGTILERYGQLAARRKPELLDAESLPLGAGTGDLLDGGEFGRQVAEWDALEARLQPVKARVTAVQQPAFFQLVEHKVRAMANLYRLYYAVAWNRRLAAANDPRANAFADRAEAAYRGDQSLTYAYHALNGGKWDGMMTQTHIGYTNWQQPDVQVMPAVKRVVAAGVAPAIRFRAPTTTPGGQIIIEAAQFSKATGGKGLIWTVIPHLGRTDGAVTTLPQGRAATTAVEGVRLDYAVDLKSDGSVSVELELVPTLDPDGRNAQAIGVSLDDGPVQVLTDRLMPAPNAVTEEAQRNWTKAVIENASSVTASFPATLAGKHVIHLWRLDDNVLVQRLVVRTAS